MPTGDLQRGRRRLIRRKPPSLRPLGVDSYTADDVDLITDAAVFRYL